MPEVFRGLIEGERWEVVGSGLYAVSDHGRVMRTASGGNAVPGSIRSPVLEGSGYPSIGMRVDRKLTVVRVHVWVAAAFIGDRPDGCVINHIDGNKTNNRIDNLEYVSQGVNCRHAISSGLRRLKLSELQVADIRMRLAGGMTHLQIAMIHGCDRSHISNIASGKQRHTAWSNQ